jgi:hypothetical protein
MKIAAVVLLDNSIAAHTTNQSPTMNKSVNDQIVTFYDVPLVCDAAPSADTAVVRLTLTQDRFEENSKLFPQCFRAWTEILSSIKTYLETGRSIPFVWKH